MGSKARPGDLVQGTLDMLVLKTLAQGPMHGYAVAEFIEEKSDSVLRVEEGALYPALHRLELRGLVHSEWGISENNRRARFYSLTSAGEQRLAAETVHWTRLASAIAAILQGA
jgi:transcriptional regulator